ncbi:unnamed protein product [Enterobius vermicularis]|uniref:Uncharacterized protein n=1 Tax=Enterobius vermicularis TaxID=51028 RepID=A0A0N4VJ75_ENTVE|nr:unnamed protein product [Enterobius vermicularis]
MTRKGLQLYIFNTHQTSNNSFILCIFCLNCSLLNCHYNGDVDMNDDDEGDYNDDEVDATADDDNNGSKNDDGDEDEHDNNNDGND